MATSSEIFDIKQNHLVGKLILSPLSKGRIVSIDTPQESSVVTVTASDLADKNIKVMNDFVPILADGYVNYLGQPVLAVFGPDSETVDTYCSKVVIDIDSDDNLKHKTINMQPVPFTWTSGNLAKYFTGDAVVVESEFNFDSKSEYLPSNEKVLASFKDDNCYVKVSSQWPMHVKDSVASALGITKAQVKVYEKSFRSDYDQLLIKPSVVSAVACVAAKKTGSLVELFYTAPSWQPETRFKRQTVINSEGKPLAEKIEVVADFGAFPLFVEESYNSILAGLVPPYDLNAEEISIKIIRSSKAPANFFGDLGYSTALAFSETHFSKIATGLGKSPYEWRTENLDKISLISEKVRRCLTYEALKQTLDECAEDCWFNRKFSVNSQSRFSTQRVSPIAGYANGIGIACGHGVGGFSEQYPYGGQYHVSISITEENKVYVSIGFYIPDDTLEIYRNLVAENLNVEKTNITFLNINSDTVRDFGPNVLSRSVCVVPRLLDSACANITKRLKRGAKLPLVQQEFYPVEEDRPLFDANTFGCVSVALHIDPVKVVPVIDNVTARLKFGKVFNTTVLARRIRQTICNTISHLCPCVENNYTVDLKVKSNPHLPAGSCSSMLSGITSSAFVSALSQALAHEVNHLPISDSDLVSIVQMNNTKKEEKDED